MGRHSFQISPMLAIASILLMHSCVISSPDHKILDEDNHFINNEHNKEYDHKAFLGEEAKEFDKYGQDESLLKLAIIVDKIDKNGNGLISFEELRDWIQFTQTRYILNDVNTHWKAYNLSDTDKLSWDEHRRNTYGLQSDEEADKLENNEEGYTYRKLIKKDKKRWNAADVDGDGKLNRDEFAAFTHPEEFERMKEIVVGETIEDIDKDNDGKISVEEYIDDMYHVEEGGEIPHWVETERDHFKKYKDTNGDGFMDEEEVKNWVLPSGFDHAESEARHLIYEADANSDELLTKKEILDNYSLFVGSQATDFGEGLTTHGEL